MNFRKVAIRVANVSSKIVSANMEQLRVEWSNVSEDYEETSDYSSVTVLDGNRVRVNCNGFVKEYDLAGSPTKDGSDFEIPDWPIDPDDWKLVNDVVQEAFGVGLNEV
jgi:hypothetical protein